MPTFDFICKICGAKRRVWRPADSPPKYCSIDCKNRGRAGRSYTVKYPITPEIHDMIRRIYQQYTGNGEVKELAAKLGYPRHKITRYAMQQGWIAKQRKEPNWTAAELAILERNAHLGPNRIQEKLRLAGFRRSVVGIVLKRRRMNYLQNLEGMTATEVAEGFGLHQSTVSSWIKKGYLRAKHRGTARTAKQGGDHYFIKAKWVREFVINHPQLIDLRKVDKFWFITLLVG